MAGEDDVVSTVDVQGADEAVAAFESIGEAGKKAMEDIDNAVEPASKAIGNVEAASFKFGESLRSLGSAVGNFATQITKATAAFAKYAAVLTGGIAAMQKFAASQDSSNDNSKQLIASARNESRAIQQRAEQTIRNAAATRQLGQSQFDAAQDAARGGARAIEDLTAAFRRGEITREQLTEQTAKLEREQSTASVRRWEDGLVAQGRLIAKQREEAQVQKELQIVQRQEEEARIRVQDQIKREVAQRKAYADNVKVFGADMANGLLQFGQSWDRLMTKFNEGPSIIGDALRAVAQFLNDNGTEIVDTFNKIGTEFSKLFDDGTQKSSNAGERIMSVFRQVTTFISSTVIPAFKQFMGLLDTIATAINNVFGTSFTGSGILAVGIILQLTGAFQLLFAIISSVVGLLGVMRVAMIALGMTPLGATLTLIVVILGLLAAALIALNWEKLKTDALDAVTAVQKFFQDLPNKVVGYFVNLWERLQADWNASVQQLKDAWDTVIKFFADLITKIQTFFVDLWDQMATAAAGAAQRMLASLMSVIPGLNQLMELIKAAKELWDQYTKSANSAVQANAAAGGDTPQGKWRGGMIHGPGTSTSDSILARLSRGEFVVRASAVKKYGVSLMHAINSMQHPGFALGGLVNSMNSFGIPRFAQGGAVAAAQTSTGRPVILHIGAEQFELFAREGETVDRLGSYAAKRQLGSAGRKASYYGA